MSAIGPALKRFPPDQAQRNHGLKLPAVLDRDILNSLLRANLNHKNLLDVVLHLVYSQTAEAN
jgi:hypothetical protein